MQANCNSSFHFKSKQNRYTTKLSQHRLLYNSIILQNGTVRENSTYDVIFMSTSKTFSLDNNVDK